MADAAPAFSPLSVVKRELERTGVAFMESSERDEVAVHLSTSGGVESDDPLARGLLLFTAGSSSYSVTASGPFRVPEPARGAAALLLGHINACVLKAGIMEMDMADGEIRMRVSRAVAPADGTADAAAARALTDHSWQEMSGAVATYQALVGLIATAVKRDEAAFSRMDLATVRPFALALIDLMTKLTAEKKAAEEEGEEEGEEGEGAEEGAGGAGGGGSADKGDKGKGDKGKRGKGDKGKKGK
jgi:hypothetical protein